ncbi:MAG: hypothetical protein WB499_18075 [Pseudolabrys sp.]
MATKQYLARYQGHGTGRNQGEYSARGETGRLPQHERREQRGPTTLCTYGQ